ncbi:MAG: hypothetical protein JEY94_04115 [Melioribacteraceae bacterium]|nr:hypothetical protein [Melioribacteraceae bacterium]
MNPIKKKYIKDKNDKNIAVQLDIDTYKKIEETLENFALFKLIEQNKEDEIFTIAEAKTYYAKLKGN